MGKETQCMYNILDGKRVKSISRKYNWIDNDFEIDFALTYSSKLLPMI